MARKRKYPKICKGCCATFLGVRKLYCCSGCRCWSALQREMVRQDEHNALVEAFMPAARARTMSVSHRNEDIFQKPE